VMKTTHYMSGYSISGFAHLKLISQMPFHYLCSYLINVNLRLSHHILRDFQNVSLLDMLSINQIFGKKELNQIFLIMNLFSFVTLA
jgi:hypothetical protein